MRRDKFSRASKPKEKPRDIGYVARKKLGDFLTRLGKNPRLRKIGYALVELRETIMPLGELPRFHAISDELLRAGQPSFAGYEKLKQLGVKTVINLRAESNREKEMVQKMGFKYRYLPQPMLTAPDFKAVLKILSLIKEQKNQPVLVHCYNGRDRAGTLAACYRITRGYTADQAIKEAVEFGLDVAFQDDKVAFIREFARYWQGLGRKA